MWNKQLTVDHLIAKWIGGTNHAHNKHKIRQWEHRGKHMYTGILPTHLQFLRIMDNDRTSLNPEFAKDIEQVVNSYEPMEIYNHKCYKEKQFEIYLATDEEVRKILMTKNK